MYVCIYIYIYIGLSLSLSYTYIYIYIYIYLQVPTYDHVKHLLVDGGSQEEGYRVHFFCSMAYH